MLLIVYFRPKKGGFLRQSTAGEPLLTLMMDKLVHQRQFDLSSQKYYQDRLLVAEQRDLLLAVLI